MLFLYELTILRWRKQGILRVNFILGRLCTGIRYAKNRLVTLIELWFEHAEEMYILARAIMELVLAQDAFPLETHMFHEPL